MPFGDAILVSTHQLTVANHTVAALSPVGLGAVRDATGSFRESLLVLVVVVLVFVVGVVLVARDGGRVEMA